MLTKKEKNELFKLVARRNEHLKGSRYWNILEYLITLLLMVVLAFSIRAVIFEPMRVRGSSMENTLLQGDYMAVEKLSYIVKPMKRGDVVICYYPNNDEYTCAEIPVAPGEEHWLLDTSLDEVYWPCSHSRAIPSFP